MSERVICKDSTKKRVEQTIVKIGGWSGVRCYRYEHPAPVRIRTEGQLPGMGPPRALDLKTRRAAPVNSSPAVGHPADAGPCPAQGSRTPPHKAPSIPVNVLPSLSSRPHRVPRSKTLRKLQGTITLPGTSFKNARKSARSPATCQKNGLWMAGPPELNPTCHKIAEKMAGPR